jgi:hypothetical protein
MGLASLVIFKQNLEDEEGSTVAVWEKKFPDSGSSEEGGGWSLMIEGSAEGTWWIHGIAEMKSLTFNLGDS